MQTARPIVDEPVVGRSRFVVAVRVLLALAWLVWAAVTFWTAPREAEVARLVEDMRAGRVVSYTTGRWPPPYLWVSLAGRSPQQGELLAWQTSSGRSYYTYPDRHLLDREDLADQLARQGVAYTRPVWLERAGLLALVLAFVAFFTLLKAPEPARGTRPFWFWVGQLPFGVGFVAWLALERPWADVTGKPRKQNGFIGFALMILGGLAGAAIIELMS